ncbi:MAG: YibE/F family protein [Desulfobacterales bacterium]|jgi:uncharacterized membrane protein
MHQPGRNLKRNVLLVLIFVCLAGILLMLPTGYEERVEKNAVRCRAKILEVDDSDVKQFGMIKAGDQGVTVEILDTRYKGKILKANNPLLGQMDRDKIFKPGDTALVVLSLDADGKILYANPQAHYRLHWQLGLMALFAVLLILFGGWTGAKALLSFIFAALMLWKILVPAMLKGYNPIMVSLIVVALLTGGIIFLVAGFTRKGLTAFCGAILGVLTSCGMAIYFTKALNVHGAVLPFAETLLYAGFGHLNLTEIYMAAVFLAASGAVMDLSMDVAASMDEVAANNPGIKTLALIGSGLRVGRAVVGTMTTTLLLAYSGGYITLLMAFMAQGVPIANLFNLIYVAAEVLKTIVGSFGLVMVAPFTALVGGIVFAKKIDVKKGRLQTAAPKRRYQEHGALTDP